MATTDVRTYYEILGVDEDISDHDLKKAFKKLITTQHPDKHPGNEEIYQEFLLITEAYETLSNPQKKLEYDEKLQYGERFEYGTRHEQNSHTQSTFYEPAFFSNDKFYMRGVEFGLAWSEVNQTIPLSDLDEGEDIFLKRKSEFAEFSTR